MSTGARLQPDPSQPSKRVDIPNWLIALIAVATIIFAAGAMSNRVAALENDHVGRIEVQDLKATQDRMDKKLDKLLERKQ